MVLETLQKRFQDLQTAAGARVAFGDPIELEGRKVIPVASVRYGFGMGGGKGPKKAETPDGPEGGGGGAGVMAEPVAVIEVTNGRVKVTPIVNVTKLAMLGMGLAAWNVFWITRAIRAGRTTRG